MSEITMRRIFLVSSFLVALASLFSPRLGFPVDFDGIIYRSIPIACLWVILFVIGIVKFRRRSLWMLLGIHLALFWPAYLFFNGLPLCYYQGGCR
jgi:hypothetical protein